MLPPTCPAQGAQRSVPHQPLPQDPQHGANSIWKSCSQYFRPSNCKWATRESSGKPPSFPPAGRSLLDQHLPLGRLDKHPNLCNCYQQAAGCITQLSFRKRLPGGGIKELEDCRGWGC